MSNEEAVYVKIPASMKRLMDDEDETNKEQVIEGLEHVLGVSAEDSTAILKRKKRRKERRVRELKEEREEIDERIDAEESKLQQITEVIEAKQQQGEDYEGQLETLLDQMEADQYAHITPEIGPVKDITHDHDRSPDEVIYDLKRLAAEQNRDLLNTRFMPMHKAKKLTPVQRRPIAETFDGGAEE